jgi:hypothetical protein
MKIRRAHGLLLICGILTGCAAGSVRELKANPAATEKFTVAANYQLVYKRLIDKFQECTAAGATMVTANVVLSTQLYSDLKLGTITYSISGVVNAVHLHIDVSGTAEGAAVESFVYYPTWKQELAKIRSWAENPAAACDL